MPIAGTPPRPPSVSRPRSALEPRRTPRQPPPPPPRRRVGVTVLAVLAILLLAGATVFLVTRRGPTSPVAVPPPAPSSEGSVAPEPTPTAEPIDLGVVAITATSTRPPQQGATYDPQFVLDDDLATAWIAGSSDMVGEGVTITLSSRAQVTELLIGNGYQKSDEAFAGNGRAAQLRVQFDGGDAVVVALEDTAGLQTVPLVGFDGAPAPPTHTLVITAAEGAEGSPGNLALSTVKARGVPG